MDDVYTLIIKPGSNEIERHGRVHVDWGHAPFGQWIGDDLRAVGGEDGAYNEAGTTVANLMTYENQFIFGDFGIQDVGGRPLTERHIAFVEAAIRQPAAVAAAHLSQEESGHYIASAADWSTLQVTGELDNPFPVANGNAAALHVATSDMEWSASADRRITRDLVEAFPSSDTRVSVRLRERDALHHAHFAAYLSVHQPHISGQQRQGIFNDADAFRAGPNWGLDVMARVLSLIADGEEPGLVIKAAAEGVPAEYLVEMFGTAD